jgi:hypothetical protein
MEQGHIETFCKGRMPQISSDAFTRRCKLRKESFLP